MGWGRARLAGVPEGLLSDDCGWTDRGQSGRGPASLFLWLLGQRPWTVPLASRPTAVSRSWPGPCSPVLPHH